MIWAKTFKDGRAKSLRDHGLDVAAVAHVWQALHQDRVAREADTLGVDPAALAGIRTFFASLHDLGKCSRAFQQKVPALWPEEFGGLREFADKAHWRLSARLLNEPQIKTDLLQGLPGLHVDDFRAIVAAIAGHHGEPPEDTDFDKVKLTGKTAPIGAAALEAARGLVEVFRTVLNPPPLSGLNNARASALSWQLSGLITLADWVGSDADHFGPVDSGLLAGDYFELAKEQAYKALAAKGLIAQGPTEAPGLAAVSPNAAAHPRPMQSHADTLKLPEGPCLIMIEDTTGSGKTEAALALAARMMAAGKGEGVYFALPTEATANAMFDRLQEAHRGLFEPKTKPSLVLAHGRAALNDAFRIVREADPDTAEAQCNDWIADNRRKAFFADIGAGTIDQAFLSILPKKFLTLRQQGLAGRILIVDEAHSFDAYMGIELEKLVEFHAAAGGSAIVLTATLSKQSRVRIATAWSRAGLGQAFTPESAAYPLLTTVSRSGCHETPVVSHATRRVRVSRLDDAPSGYDRAEAAARRGAAVLVLRNAVDEVVASADALRERGLAVDLFHARFAYCDRQKKETDALRRFGPHADPADRAGRILVASQVVEQSLDVDFDLIVTDLAPIDLIIQRAGRLWRHDRPRPIDGPDLLVIAPDPAKAATPNWLEPALGKGAFVYRHPGILWRSARILFERGAIETPDDLRALIESVYGSEEIPEILARSQDDAIGEGYSREALGRWNTVSRLEGYGTAVVPSPDQDVGTRLGEATRIVRLAQYKDGELLPWAGAGDWARSELAIRCRWLKGLREPADLKSLLSEALEPWPEWDESLIGLVETDGTIRLERSNGERPFTYSAERGLLRYLEK